MSASDPIAIPKKKITNDDPQFIDDKDIHLWLMLMS